MWLEAQDKSLINLAHVWAITATAGGGKHEVRAYNASSHFPLAVFATQSEAADYLHALKEKL